MIPKYTRILIIGSPKHGPQILGKPHVASKSPHCWSGGSRDSCDDAFRRWEPTIATNCKLKGDIFDVT